MNADSDASHWKAPRILAAVFAILLTAFTLLVLLNNGVAFLTSRVAGFVLAPATLAALLWWFAIRGHDHLSRRRMTIALIGAVGLGGIAFLGGFLGPMILKPDANQGPLLGILITGPLGFSAGAVLGALYSFIRVRRRGQLADSTGSSL